MLGGSPLHLWENQMHLLKRRWENSLLTSQILSPQVGHARGETHRTAPLEPPAFDSCCFIQVPKQLWRLLKNLSQIQSAARGCRTHGARFCACLVPGPYPRTRRQGVLGPCGTAPWGNRVERGKGEGCCPAIRARWLPFCWSTRAPASQPWVRELLISVISWFLISSKC